MLPACRGTHATDGSVDNLQAGAIALAPDHPFVIGRRDLATLEFQAAIRVEDQLSVIERAVVALIDAKDDNRIAFARGVRDGPCFC